MSTPPMLFLFFLSEKGFDFLLLNVILKIFVTSKRYNIRRPTMLRATKINTIGNYFKRLPREDIELEKLTQMQQSRK